MPNKNKKAAYDFAALSDLELVVLHKQLSKYIGTRDDSPEFRHALLRELGNRHREINNVESIQEKNS